MARTKCPAVLFLLFLLVSPSRIKAEDLNTQLMRATVKISHAKSTAAGFVLTVGDGAKHVLVSAAHVFDNTPDDKTTVIFRSQQAEGEYKKEPVELIIRQDGKPLWTKHPTEDVAVIAVTPPEHADLPLLSNNLLATDETLKLHQIHPGDRLACLGYPHREEGSPAGFPLLRAGVVASFPLLPTAKTKSFYLSANVFEGDSGGPVYLNRESRETPDAADVNLIMGLISGQRFLDEEAKMIYGAAKFRHRLGLAVVIHASLIKETIDRLP